MVLLILPGFKHPLRGTEGRQTCEMRGITSEMFDDLSWILLILKSLHRLDKCSRYLVVVSIQVYGLAKDG